MSQIQLMTCFIHVKNSFFLAVESECRSFVRASKTSSTVSRFKHNIFSSLDTLMSSESYVEDEFVDNLVSDIPLKNLWDIQQVYECFLRTVSKKRRRTEGAGFDIETMAIVEAMKTYVRVNNKELELERRIEEIKQRIEESERKTEATTRRNADFSRLVEDLQPREKNKQHETMEKVTAGHMNE